MNSSQNKNREFRDFLQNLPKTEIHLHIEGLTSVDTIWSLIQENKLNYEGIDSKDDLRKKFQISSLGEFLSLFINVVQNSFQKESDLEYLITDTQDYLERNNIFYTEIFFSPSKFIQNGFSFETMIDILDNGSKRIKEKSNRTVKYLIDVSRTFGPENAMNNLNLILDHPRQSVIGIGLGGAEDKGPAADYTEVFAKAKSKGLEIVTHAGEIVGPESIWDSLKKLHASRIGHGISAIQDEDLMEYLVKNQIPLEICPTSNIFTRHYVDKLTDHPIKKFFERGIYVTLNTDDPTFFGAELVDEYMNLVDADMFTHKEVLQLVKNNHFATFMTEAEKNETWLQIDQFINQSNFGK